MSKDSAALEALAQTLDEVLNGDARGKDRKIGFCLFIFPFGEVPEESKTHYISNASRQDMCAAMKEVIARWEGQPLTAGHA